MWPFGAARPALRVGDGTVEIDTVATVAGDEGTVSPVSGKSGVFFHYGVEELSGLLGALGKGRDVGAVVLGDLVGFLVELEDGSVPVDVAVRRAVFSFLEEAPAQPMLRSIPELTPYLLERHTGTGSLGYREKVILAGTRFRFRGWVERVRMVGSGGYGSVPEERLVVAPVAALRLDELGGAPESGA